MSSRPRLQAGRQESQPVLMRHHDHYQWCRPSLRVGAHTGAHMLRRSGRAARGAAGASGAHMPRPATECGAHSGARGAHMVGSVRGAVWVGPPPKGGPPLVPPLGILGFGLRAEDGGVSLAFEVENLAERWAAIVVAAAMTASSTVDRPPTPIHCPRQSPEVGRDDGSWRPETLSRTTPPSGQGSGRGGQGRPDLEVSSVWPTPRRRTIRTAARWAYRRRRHQVRLSG